ncbi:MAG: hypothetical protein AUI47_03375 [Acidobacteria bacterium 13_1_40CM_2_68_5]|nr:MAG: hypothetical protein AUI47_03375 [Acidobacteria bacterium 13_1_40CM_2_68_5]
MFALAGLTRETTVVFGLAYGLAVLAATDGGSWRERLAKTWQRSALFLAIAVLPLVVYKIFLLSWLGVQHDAGLGLASFPFQGLWPFRWWGSPPMVEQIRSVVAPGLIAGAAAMLALIRGVRRVEVWVLLANVVLFVVLLQAGSYADYSAAGRVTTGVVLSAVLCLPWIAPPARRSWFWVCALLWLALVPFWLVFPTLHYYLQLIRGIPT